VKQLSPQKFLNTVDRRRPRLTTPTPRSTRSTRTDFTPFGTYLARTQIGRSKTGSELHKRWCAMLGLNQRPSDRTSRGLSKICDLRALVVAWSLADLAGRAQPGIEEVKSAMGFRRMGADR
jgi:hypothetical protein